MVWLWALGWSIYGLLGLVFARMLAGHMAWKWCMAKAWKDKKQHPYLERETDPNQAEPSGEQWVGACFWALMLAVIWPVSLLLVWWPIKAGAEIQAEKRHKDRIIHDLEKQLNL